MKCCMKCSANMHYHARRYHERDILFLRQIASLKVNRMHSISVIQTSLAWKHRFITSSIAIIKINRLRIQSANRSSIQNLRDFIMDASLVSQSVCWKCIFTDANEANRWWYVRLPSVAWGITFNSNPPPNCIRFLLQLPFFPRGQEGGKKGEHAINIQT